MARSSHIWVLFQGNFAIAAFTVKHELVSFVKREIGVDDFLTNDDCCLPYEVLRFKDGCGDPYDKVDLWKLVRRD
jgi:hypothetical protein